MKDVFVEAFRDRECGYNDFIVCQGKTLSSICDNDKTFEQDFFNEKCDKIDAIIEKIGNKNKRLKELKRSLINEVVTGKRAITACKPC